jgi:nucleotide-binding universal stress UspA family protein
VTIMRKPVRLKNCILLSMDFSKPARQAYIYALRLAALLDHPLVLLHVVTAPPGAEASSSRTRRSLASRKTGALLKLGRMLRLAEDDGISTGHKLLVGIPQDVILKVADETQASLIVIGTHGRTGWKRLQLGSVALDVLRKAACPVLTVHAGLSAHLNGWQRPCHRFVVGVDFSPSSQAALRASVMLAKRLEARIWLTHAVHVSGSSASMLTHRRLENAAAQVQADRIVVESLAEHGHPVKVILDQAKRMKADLIVLGTNGHRGVKRLVLGSVAESVVRSAGCPVLVVKARPRPA